MNACDLRMRIILNGSIGENIVFLVNMNLFIILTSADLIRLFFFVFNSFVHRLEVTVDTDSK